MASSRKKKQLGATLIELLTAAGITIVVLLGSLSILVAGSASWAQGLSKIGAEMDAQMSVRAISQQLAEAMFVSVDSDGMGLTYRLPEKDATGNYVLPITWDGVSRRIEVQNKNLVLIDRGVKRVLAHGLILTDPLSSRGTAPYHIFTPGAGTLTRQVTVEVATQR